MTTSERRLDGLSVLVLEDEYLIADDTRRALESGGAEVVGPFARAADALASAEQRAPDCAIVDINLGHGIDFSTAQALLGRGVPVVLVTGYDLTVIPADLAYLPRVQKPAPERAICTAVAEACGR